MPNIPWINIEGTWGKFDIDWANVHNTPLTYAPTQHDHEISEVTGLQDILDTIEADTNTYLSSASFDTDNGVITFTMNNTNEITVDIDGRYLDPDLGGVISADLFLCAAELKIDTNNQYPLKLYSNGVNMPSGLGIQFDTSAAGQVGYLIADHMNGRAPSDYYGFYFGSTELVTDVVIEGDGNFWVGSNQILHSGYSVNQPGALTLTEYADYINITFAKNGDDVDYYEIYSSIGDTNNYALISIANHADFTTNVSIDDTTYNRKTTIYYKVIAVYQGHRSTARTGSKVSTQDVGDVTNLRVQRSVGAFHLSWVLPDDRRLSTVQVFVDYETTSGALSKPASPVFSGHIDNFDYEVPDAYLDYYHKFWVDTVTRA